MNTSFSWYQQLLKPSWAPPSWLFGPVWSVLYLIIALSFGSVLFQVLAGKLPRSLAVPFLLNLVLNALYSPVQFGLRNNYLGSIVILSILASLIWTMISIWKYQPWVSYVNIPYLLWVSFATILQLTLTYLNR